MRQLLSGQILNYNTSVTTVKEIMRCKYHIIKFTRANRLLRWMAEKFPIKPPILIIRHPCAVVSSQILHGGWKNYKLKWGYDSRFRSIIGALLLPHYNVKWIINGYKEGIRIIKDEKIDLIYSTVPDPEAYIIALLLSVVAGKKFLCDFRDPTPWMYEKIVSLENLIMKFLQKVTQWKGYAIVSISSILTIRLIENEWLMNRKKYVTIYNGFDINDFKSINRIDKKKIYLQFCWQFGKTKRSKIFVRGF